MNVCAFFLNDTPCCPSLWRCMNGCMLFGWRISPGGQGGRRRCTSPAPACRCVMLVCHWVDYYTENTEYSFRELLRKRGMFLQHYACRLTQAPPCTADLLFPLADTLVGRLCVVFRVILMVTGSSAGAMVPAGAGAGDALPLPQHAGVSCLSVIGYAVTRRTQCMVFGNS